MTEALPILRAIIERMADAHPLTRWGRRVRVEVGVGEFCTTDLRVTSFGVAHVHPPGDGIIAKVHVVPYYLTALETGVPYVADPVDVMAECWAIARKPRYSAGKRAWWVARISSTYRNGVSQ